MTTVDCSHPLESGMPVYPGDEPVEIEETATVSTDGSCIRRLDLSSHTGTHVDAPAHKVADGRTLDTFDPADFRMDAYRVDCTDAGPREPLDLSVLPDALETESGIEPDAVVFHTGWDEYWGSERYRDSPYLAGDLASWCARAGFHVGLDTFSPDPVPSSEPDREGDDEPTDQPAHSALCGGGCLILENLRGLARLPNRFELRAFPLPIERGDGSPIRAVAATDH